MVPAIEVDSATCTSPCKHCVSGAPTECLGCDSAGATPKYVRATNECVAACPSGTTQSSTDVNQCIGTPIVYGEFTFLNLNYVDTATLATPVTTTYTLTRLQIKMSADIAI
jgi:hypothetical protein